MDIRSEYQKYGVENFYQYHFDQYKNPHESIIEKSINIINDNWIINFNNIISL